MTALDERIRTEQSGKAAKLSGVDRKLFEYVCDHPGCTRAEALGVVPSEAGWDDLLACSDIELVVLAPGGPAGAYSTVRLITCTRLNHEDAQGRSRRLGDRTGVARGHTVLEWIQSRSHQDTGLHRTRRKEPIQKVSTNEHLHSPRKLAVHKRPGLQLPESR